MNEARGPRYPGAAMLLHWLIAAGVIAQWRIAEAAEHAQTEEAGGAIMSNHFALGLVLLVLVLLRLMVRTVRPNPPLAEHLAGWERALSKTIHTLFYALLIAMPIAGWIALSMFDAPIDLWGLVTVPALPLEENKDAAEAIFSAHATAGTVLLGLAVLHILGTLKHTLIDRDGNLFRMLPLGTPKA